MFNNNYNVVKNGVCSVISDFGVGTGWLYRRTNGLDIDKTIYVVTAAHIVVVRNENYIDNLYEPTVLIQNVNNSGRNQYFSTKIISVDKKGDIALLQIQNNGQTWLNHTTLRVTTATQTVGSPIYIVGYPMGFDYNSIAGGYLRENNASDFFTPTSLYYNLASNPGNSGSPVFNTSNFVIGMLQWGSAGDEMNGGIRGDLLYYFLETSIASFVASNKTSYNNFFKKQYIEIFTNGLNTFYPLSGELIRYLQKFNWATGYSNGGRSIEGILLLYGYSYTSAVIEKITYTTNTNVIKTINLSSSLYDRSSIWEVLYFAKPNTNITIFIYDVLTKTDNSYLLTLKEMPAIYDYFLTEGFSKKQEHKNIMDANKNFQGIKIQNNFLLEKTNLKKIEIQEEKQKPKPKKFCKCHKLN
jgi:V8-like Glu-specific endopeptidase